VTGRLRKLAHLVALDQLHNGRVARLFLSLGAVFGFLGVALGAFGAHALRDRLSPSDLEIFKTGVQYQSYHAAALLVVGTLILIRPEMKRLQSVGYLFTLGTVIFSGSLYILSVTGIRWFGAITPIGGICYLAGWFIFLVAVASLPADWNS